ncbi:MAG: hypothetical protein AB7K09_08310 [Planctomycetota bacterium]
MKVRPVTTARNPAYPTASVVFADPRVFVTTHRPEQRWKRYILPGLIAATGSALIGAVAIPIYSTPMMGIPCRTPPAFSQAGAISIITDEMGLAGYSLQTPTAPVAGVWVDAATPDGRMAIEWFDPEDNTTIGDEQLQLPAVMGTRQLQLPLADADNAAPVAPGGPVLGLFDAIDEATLRQQVRDFILWLEAQH